MCITTCFHVCVSVCVIVGEYIYHGTVCLRRLLCVSANHVCRSREASQADIKRETCSPTDTKSIA